MRKESQNESEISMTDIVSVRGNNLTLVAISLSWDRKAGVVNHQAVGRCLLSQSLRC